MSVGIQASINKFAFLHVQDSSEEESGESSVKGQPSATAKKTGKANSNAANTKKKTRRRKKKHTSSTSSDATGNEGSQMQEWIRHDQELVDELYDEDLKRALEMSKVEFEKVQSETVQQAAVEVHDTAHSEISKPKEMQKEKKKTNKKSRTISLEEFHQHIEQTLPLHDIKEDTKEKPVENPKSQSTKFSSNFFNEVQEEANSIKRNEYITQQYRNTKKTKAPDPGSGNEIKNKRDKREIQQIIDEKNEIILELQMEVRDWEKQYRHVKKRNQQLLLMLQQGESMFVSYNLHDKTTKFFDYPSKCGLSYKGIFSDQSKSISLLFLVKDKCELLMEVERLGVLRDELTQEVATLNESLEQERSKARKFKDELLKYQNRKPSDDVSSSKS